MGKHKTYSKSRYISRVRKASGKAHKKRAAEVFLRNRKDQSQVIDNFYHCIEELVKDNKIHTIKDVRTAYQDAPYLESEFHEMFMLGRVMHDLLPMNITERLTETNGKKKNGRRNLFTSAERAEQRRVSSALYRGGRGSYGHNTAHGPDHS